MSNKSQPSKSAPLSPKIDPLRKLALENSRRSNTNSNGPTRQAPPPPSSPKTSKSSIQEKLPSLSLSTHTQSSIIQQSPSLSAMSNSSPSISSIPSPTSASQNSTNSFKLSPKPDEDKKSESLCRKFESKTSDDGKEDDDEEEDYDAKMKRDRAVPVNSKPELKQFDLVECLRAIKNDEETTKQLEQYESKIHGIRQEIISASRKNFILERELTEIDEKIKLLVRNRISVQEVISQSAGLQPANNESIENNNPIRDKRQYYEDLFYLLQSRPKYFAALSRLCSAKEIPTFVQTVVFDMYGDQYDTREERLLLDLFRTVLKAELENTSAKGSLLRANTAITQMLSAYARRGQGLSILKEILEEPLKHITSQRDMNLEINPQKVYQQMITDFETETGRQCELPRSVDDDTASKNSQVQQIIEQRKKELLNHADTILKRIISGVDNIPYGMRWICKQLGILFKQKYPNADKYQIGSLMGGYIYLRFFNPVIVTPDAINFVSVKPNRVMRRNLILIAKVLQNLSNGLLFGDKEVYMKVLNSYIQERMDPLQGYFERLVKVDDLEYSLQVDKYLEHASVRQNVIQISFNQIFLIHSLLEKHLSKLVADENDPVIEILKKLGPSPQPVDKSQNRTLILQLIDRRATRLQSALTNDNFQTALNGASIEGSSDQLYYQAKESIRKLLLSLVPANNGELKIPCNGLFDYLEYEKKKADDAQNRKLFERIVNVISILNTLLELKKLPQMVTVDQTFNAFLHNIAEPMLEKVNRLKSMMKTQVMVDNAIKHITTHHEYLQLRLDLYKKYLENVRKGQTQENIVSEKKKKAKNETVLKKFTHAQLEEMKVMKSCKIEKIAEVFKIDKIAEAKELIRKLTYTFSMVSPGKFNVEVTCKKFGVDIKVNQSPIEIVLDELLKMQEHNQLEYEIVDDIVTLHVNLFIHLLNTHFVAKKR